MNLKYRIPLVVAIGVFAMVALALFRVPSQPGVIAKSDEGGVVVPNTDDKVRLYANGVYKIEPQGFAITDAVRDMPTSEPDAASKAASFRSLEERIEEQRLERLNKERIEKGLPPLTARQKEEFEINQQNSELVKHVKPGAGLGDSDFTDPLLSKGIEPNAPQTMPTPTLSFDGATAVDNAAQGIGGLSPPDTNGDVGPNHYVSSINLVLKFFNKNGTVAAGPVKTSSLWAALPATDACRLRNDGDPVVVYDSLADRWHISQFALAGYFGTGPANLQCAAVSQTSDPTGAYYVWSYVYPGSAFNDYPKVAVWPDAYHMTFNQFNNAGNTFLGMGILSQDRVKALAGDPTASAVYTNIFTIDPAAGGGLAADVDGIVPPPAGMAEVIGEYQAVDFGDPMYAMRFYKWVPNFATPASSTISVLPDVPLATFDARQPSGRTDIEQMGGSSLDSISDRLMFRLAYRNLGSYATPVNSIVGSFSVNVSGVSPASAATYQTGIRWFEMRRVADVFTVFDQGTHNLTPGDGAAGLNNWMSSIAQDNRGDIALGFSQASTTQQASIKIAGRTNNVAASGTLNEGEATFYAAAGSQSGSSRWGDYSSMTVDPVDDCTFWYTQEYYAATSSVGWATRVGTFKYPACTAAPKGTITGTITSCSSGLPVGGASVDATGGFNRLTIANGTYSMFVTPGNYTVSASKTGGFVGASQNTSVANGGTSTVNICMNGVAVLSQGSSSIVSESCGIPNSVPDPGETLTVSLAISNIGAANTVNLVATLQASGGVTNPGAAQSYGIVLAGGAAVSRNFSFTVNPATTCGANITLTWNLTDGTTNFGTMTKTYGTGTPVLNLNQNFDGVTAPALPTGWTQNQTSGTGITWVTSTTTPSSTPNAAFANDPATVNATALESPAFPVAVSNATLTFQKAFTTESTFDGVVLEIKIGTGAWTDIVAAGGSFVTGGYNATISSSFASPIAGRQAWSGAFPAYTATQVNLPASANGQNVQLRWLMASDNSVASTGFNLDNVQVTAGVQCQGPCTSGARAPFDFDGDHKTDISIFRPSVGEWWYQKSSDGGVGALQFGSSTDKVVAADYTGDGKADIAFFRPSTGQWFILRSEDFSFFAFPFGATGDIPVPADYDGDGKADAAVFRPSTNTWFILRSAGGTTITQFGAAGDLPVAADYDGDGKADIAILRPNGVNGAEWWIQRSTAGLLALQFGFSTDKAVPGDYTGDGKADVAFYHPSTGQWYVLRSEDFSYFAFPFGAVGDIPVPGDYDGDGKTDAAVFRPSNATWYVLRSTAGQLIFPFGNSTDTPLPNAYVRN